MKVKKKDYMTDIQNSKRLIPKYAREEREKFRQRMQELGFETAADRKKAENLANQSKHELYSRLEQNMNRAVSRMQSQQQNQDIDIRLTNEYDDEQVEEHDDYNT